MYEDYIGKLKHTVLFEGIEESQLLAVLNCLQPSIHKYTKNQIVILEGEKLNGIGIVLSGKVDVAKESANGNRIILSKVSEGSIFAEVASFSNSGISVATVIATVDTQVMFISPEKITNNCERLCEAHKRLTRNVLNILANKAMNLNRKIEYLAIKSMRGRLCAFIVNMHEKSQKAEIHIPFNRNELADYLGVSRPSMSRELGRMRDEGLIDFKGNKVLIKELSALKKCIDN